MRRKSYQLKADGTAGTRGDAVVYGLKHYSTGKACSRGHMARRYTSTGACTVCVAMKQAEGDKHKREAQAMLMEGNLPKSTAIALRSPFYCSQQALDCGHYAWQLVIDDSCKTCNDQERIKRELEIAQRMLS